MAKRSQSARSAVNPQDRFIDNYTDYALAVAEIAGIAPEVVLGQTALETGWGKSVAGGNMFGIKGAGQSVVTHEDIPGKGMVKTTESFRAYSNPLDSFMDYGRLMDNSRYGHIGKNQTVDQQVASIGKSGYATDRNYGRKLGDVVDRIQANKNFQNKVVSNATASIPMADTFLGDLGAPPIGQVTASSIPDITPAREAGFSWDLSGATLPADLSLDFGGPSFGSILDGLDLSGQRLSENVEVRSVPDWGDIPGFSDPTQAALNNAQMRDAYYDGRFNNDPLSGTLEGVLNSQPVDYGRSYPDITEGMYSPGPSSWSTDIAPATPNFSDVDVGSFPDISSGLYSGIVDGPTEFTGPTQQAPAAAFSGDPLASREMANFTTPSQPSGFAAGFDEGPWGATPDFSAPSLAQRNAVDAFEGAMAVRNNTAPDLLNESIAQNVMNELAPQTPSMAPAPVASVTAPAPVSPSTPMGDFDEFGPNFPSASVSPQATAPAPQAAPPTRTAAPSVSLPAAPAPAAPAPTRTQQQVAKDFDLPSFSLPDMGLPSFSMPTVRDIGSTFGLMDPTVNTGFMDAMANPQIAQGWSPGFLDTRLGKGVTSAGMGFLTGGPFGAITSGLWSGLGIGDRLASEWDRFSNAYANLSPLDFAAFAADGNMTDREPTRRDESGNATVGDGSYGGRSGTNSNNPQGIL